MINMAKANKSTPDSKERELYRKLVATVPGVDVKGDSMLYTSMNGNMYSFIDKEDKVGLRLSKEDREAFLEKYDTTLFHAHGTVLKEYVTVPGDLLSKTSVLKKHFAKSHEYAQTLKPKPTKKEIKNG